MVGAQSRDGYSQATNWSQSPAVTYGRMEPQVDRMQEVWHDRDSAQGVRLLREMPCRPSSTKEVVTRLRGRVDGR